MKLCKICGKNKRLNQFRSDASRKDGLYYKCKSCEHSYYLDNKERIIKRMRNWRQKNRKELNIFFWRKTASRYELVAEDLMKQFLIQEKKCFYCKIPLTANNLQIEHFYPKKTKIVISCKDCNRLKWDRDGDEFIKFIHKYVSRFNNR